MSLNRAAHRAGPLLFQHHLRTSRRLPSKIPAIAILIPRQYISTDTPTPNSTSGTVPPPGFNINQAKKPVNDQKNGSRNSKDAATSSQSKTDLSEKINFRHEGPTAHPKGDAFEAQTLTELAAGKTSARKTTDEKAVAAKKEEEVKLTLWQKVKREVNHYWDGTKLLAAEVRISSKLALKMAAGYELTRRENRQVILTGAAHAELY